MKYGLLLFVVIFFGFGHSSASNTIDSLKQKLSQVEKIEDEVGIQSELMIEYIHFNLNEEAKHTKNKIYEILNKDNNDLVQLRGWTGLLAYYTQFSEADSAQLFASKLENIILQDTDPFYNQISVKVVAQFYKIQNDFQKSKFTLIKGIDFFKKKKDNRSKNKLMGELALIYDIQGMLDSSIYFYEKQLKYFGQQNDLQSKAVVFQNMGVAYYYQGKFEDALEEFIAAKKVFVELKDTITVFELNANIGVLFTEIEQYEKALKYLDEAKSYAEKFGDDRQKGRIYSFLGSCYESQDSTKRALDFHLKSLEYHKKINSIRDMAINYHNLGVLYEDEGNLNLAKKNYVKAIQLKQDLGMELSLAYSEAGLGRVFLKHGGQTSQAYKWLSAAMVVFKQQNALKDMRDVYEAYADIFSTRGDYEKAFDYLKKFTLLNDSLSSAEAKERISDLEIKYEVAQKEQKIIEQDKEIALSEKEKAKKDLLLQEKELEAQKNRNLAMITAVTFILILVIVVWLINRKRLKKENKLHKALAREKEKGLQMVLSTQEDERQRIAKELHDGIVQDITAIKMKLREVEGAKEIEMMLDNASKETREISYQMMPLALRELGLIPALEDVLEKVLSPKNIVYEFEQQGLNERLPEKIEISLFRIVQELLNNIIKHSQATEVHINLSKLKQKVVLIVEDNGIGFNSQAIKKGIGLNSLDSRVKIVNGEVRFETNNQTGTTAFIRIPLTNKI